MVPREQAAIAPAVRAALSDVARRVRADAASVARWDDPAAAEGAAALDALLKAVDAVRSTLDENDEPGERRSSDP